MQQYLLLLLSIISSYALNTKPSIKSKEDCPRIRRAWHLLSSNDQQFVFDGMFDLRNADNYKLDELVQITEALASPYVFNIIHQSSANLFWHGYLVWELESRIRALDEKYKCFAMPYYDFTIDFGHESHASILDSLFGGTSDSENNYKMNEFTWKDVSVEDWFVSAYCPNFPNCGGTIIPSATEIADYFTNDKYSNFKDFSKYYNHKNKELLFLTEAKSSKDPIFLDSTTVSGAAQGYEPIWWLFHSFIQYHLSMWINCNGFDGQNTVGGVEQLKDDTNAYTAYCGGFMTDITDTEDCKNGDSGILAAALGSNFVKKYPLDFKLDSPLFVPLLQDYEWSFVNKHSLTVRELYYISDWNVKYDVGSFYYAAELYNSKTFCNRKLLNNEWFVDNDNGLEYYLKTIKNGEFNLLDVNGVFKLVEREKIYDDGGVNAVIMVFVFGIFAVFLFCVVFKFCCADENKYDAYISVA